MEKSSNHSTKRNSTLLLFGVGISTLGDFIYLVAINILVLNLTGSPAAVAGLWIIGPIASILTKFWSGSIIDRMNKRRLMILMDIIRSVIVAIVPFFSSIWLIYICLFFLSVSKAFFEPTSMTYITTLIPQKQRKQFNSFRSLITSGAFLVGPAIAGLLLLITTAKIAIWINAVSFLISAIILYLLPNVEGKKGSESYSINLKTLQQDWKDVLSFSHKNVYIVKVYFLAQLFIVIALGMDAQEVVFTQQVLGLSETDFGLLISITGIGSIVGAGTVSLLAKRMSIQMLIGAGYMMVAVGYLIYAFSFSFLSVAIGFIILGYFNAFSNTGFMTFYQNNVPVDMMGRISSVYGTFQSIFQIVFILLIGFTGEVIPLRYSVVGASLFILCTSILLIIMVYKPSQKRYFIEDGHTEKFT
ncbi:MFS family permease [Bacillus pakistanensis]|uniref:MFS family permease n=1 Tax=Rossellomorea pakistanensis TaxID=992288 RepID=A0ABS2N739_9BACI|nr:MFS transporter [Bacillus pakistanensis]MBM7583667.1 MFS family permease [Bacillus pakistanensis]